MGRSALRESAILAALSGPAGSINLIVPIYLGHLGYSFGAIGLIIGLSGIATLVSRFPVVALYRPERSRALLIGTLSGGGLSFAVMPFMPDLITFSVALVANRIFFGLASTFFLARFLDMMAEGTDRRRAMGYYSGTQAVGYTTSNLLIGVLADFVGYVEAFLYGTVFSLAAVVLLFWAADPASRAAHVSTAGGAGRAYTRGVLLGVADPGLWRVLNGSFWNHTLHIVLVAFFPLYAAVIGLGATQIGLTRAVYSGVNAVARPISGIVTERWSTRPLTYAGIALQAALLFAIPLIDSLTIFLALFVASAFGRAVVIVANSTALAEDVDETRVSRGVATSMFSAAPDVSSIAGPLLAGVIAGAAGVGPMFAVTAAGTVVFFMLGEAGLTRWRSRVSRSRPVMPSPLEERGLG